MRRSIPYQIIRIVLVILTVCILMCSVVLGFLSAGLDQEAGTASLFGWHFHVNADNHMLPVLPNPTLVISSPVEEDAIQSGNVLVYTLADDKLGTVIQTRRVKNVSAGIVTLQGDNEFDQFSISASTARYLGIARYNFPFLGQLLIWVRSNTLSFILTSLAGVILLFSIGMILYVRSGAKRYVVIKKIEELPAVEIDLDHLFEEETGIAFVKSDQPISDEDPPDDQIKQSKETDEIPLSK